MTISTKTVAVYDGAERKLVHTTANDPGIVARAAGLQLSADDDVFFTDDPIFSLAGMSEVSLSPIPTMSDPRLPPKDRYQGCILFPDAPE